MTKIGVAVGSRGVDLWVFMDDEDVAAEDLVSAAERTYLNATAHGELTLHVIPGASVPPDALPLHETLLER